MISVGVDIIEIASLERVLARWGDRFLERVYTPAEVTSCRGRVSELAARFAAKEAISKALGTGMQGIDWREMEILPDARGKPRVNLCGRAQQRAEALGLNHFAVSLSHSQEHVVSVVIAW